MLMLNRVIAFVALALGSCLMLGCQTQVLTPAQLQAAQAASDTYRAYERGDCATVRRLADPDLLKTWEFNEMRHSMLLVQGFCREIDGDIAGARDIYRELVLDAPTSFAADHAAERARILKLVEQDPDYARRTRAAREGVDPDGRTRTPLDRIPVEFPPLAHAMAIEGYTVVEFGVTQRGDTEDPVVVDSSPPLLFDGASLRAVRRWKYRPESSMDGDDRQLIRFLFKRDGSQKSDSKAAMRHLESPSVPQLWWNPLATPGQ